MTEFYMFYSPLDQMPVTNKDYDVLSKKAHEYLGKEDWEGEIVKQITIFKVTVAGITYLGLEDKIVSK